MNLFPIRSEDRTQTIEKWLRLLQLKPHSIISQMSQLSRIILTQMTTLHIPGVRRISQHFGKNHYIGEANGLFIGTGIFILLL
ncbi:MAG: hypothetical protein O4861_20265 [Trichodesmium sp. St16_bin4-tuft]|nr:hypothetical protein [Trichodesmium sp. St5_bin8]MDE5078426.1 hypothetical protein [Trichodesmium sp. St2_bin6]MDE5100537.1 hypothetical protein [Trichodesmium sp. St16_bin4-tuft]MDE5104992.1 hypothetical protein [Trichodesmium sp. St19_bin2]